MIYTHSFDYTITSDHTEIPVQTGRLETRVPGGASSIPREQLTRSPWQPTSHHIYSGPEGHTDTNNKAGNRIYQGMSHMQCIATTTRAGIYEKITCQFTVPLRKFVNEYLVIPFIDLKHVYITDPVYYNRNNMGFLPGLYMK